MSPVDGDQLSALLVPVLIILGISIVAVVGWLIWALTHPKGGEASDAMKTSVVASDVSTPCFVGITRGNRGEWKISVEGRPYPRLDAVPNPDTRAQVTNAIRALATFAGYARQPSESPAAVQAPDIQVDVTTGPRSGPRARASAAAAVTPVRGGAATLAIDLADEIGEIIGEMMAQRPDLRGHAVTLQNRTEQGIAFVVDGTIYQEISDIPSPEIQALIRDATKEWERR